MSDRPTPAEKIFAALPGAWALRRNFPGTGTLEGSVVFTRESETRLRCDEQGTLSLEQGGPIAAHRSYIYEGYPDRIVILYNDPHRSGEVLHELVFSEEDGALVSDHCHVCVDDRYDLKFRFSPAHGIEMDYRVRGPAKDYSIHSQLTPKL